ncbi:MAG: hypothetical protein WCC99_22460 [Candidatus Sulfotelmatobacter sp.]
MTGKLLLLVLLTMPVSAQQGKTAPVKQQSNIAEPGLPVIDYNACPFEGCTFRKWKVTRDSKMYSSWQLGRSEIGRLRPGQEVTGLTGVHITRKPNRILVKQPLPDLGLQPGDVILRYMYLGEGFANIWFKGSWHKQFDCTFITEKSNEGCLRDCSAIVTEAGAKDWWVKVKTAAGKTGWVLVQDNFDGMDAFARQWSSFSTAGL